MYTLTIATSLTKRGKKEGSDKKNTFFLALSTLLRKLDVKVANEVAAAAAMLAGKRAY